MKKLITLLIVLVTLNGYSQTDDVIEYYNEICANSEWSGKKTPSRYKKDIKIYYNGNVSDELIMELNKIVSELNELIDIVNVELVDQIDSSNVYLFFGSGEEFINSLDVTQSKKNRLYRLIKSNWGIFSTNESWGTIIDSKVFVDTDRNKQLVRQKHLLREELTQSLGFPNDSYEYEDSIFQQKWTEVTEYSDLDREIIKLHYLSQK
jgi:hypothetical protein